MLRPAVFAFTACVLILPLSLSAALNPAQSYRWQNVRIGGGGFVTGLVYHPREKGLLYARTDVGGAYRWNHDTRTWTCLTDFIGAGDVNLTGIESIAVDPADSNRVYLAAGTYTNPRVPTGAMLLSADRGQSFKRVNLPFKLGANEAGRGNGERLAVDPHQGTILFFGSRADGLWRSEDRGETWASVKTFPSAATSEATTTSGRWKQPVGIVSVIFDDQRGDQGQPTPVLFAALSSREVGLYRSQDAGTNWELIPGQPTDLRPQRLLLSRDRWLYVTFGDEPAPNGMVSGAVWRWQVDENRWEEITPLKPNDTEKFGYCGLAVDPDHADTLLVATFSRWKPGDEIFRTRDGGKTWSPVLASSTWNHETAPWTKDARPHWMAALQIDPHDRNHAWFTTGYGVWETRNLAAVDRGSKVEWHFSDDGLEETVPLGLISPTEGPHLVSAVGDLDGFRHDDFNRSPLQLAAPPRFANSESIAFAGLKPNMLVRTGTIRNRTSADVAAAYSTDGGESWQRFAKSPSDGAAAGHITVNSDASVVVWTPRGSAAVSTSDRGASWTVCQGLSAGVRVVADRVKPTLFYALDDRRGDFWRSEDAALRFALSVSNLPKPVENAGGSGFGGGRGNGVVYATPDHAKDVWIGFRENGLYHSTDGGDHFESLSGVEKVVSFGFGKSPPDRSYPTLFLAGTIEGVTGLFRSDDAGQSWSRINDDQHQFGAINHVTGDPRIYGRVYFGTSGRGIFYGEIAH